MHRRSLIRGVHKVDPRVPQGESLLVARLCTEVGEVDAVLLTVGLVAPRKLNYVGSDQLERETAVFGHVQEVLAHTPFARPAIVVARVCPGRQEPPLGLRGVKQIRVNRVLVLKDPPVLPAVLSHEVHKLVGGNQNG